MTYKRLTEFGRALKQFEEAVLEENKSQLAIDVTIQRFEFTFELAWKALQEVLKEKELVPASYPKLVLQEAYAVGWITDEQLWVDMLKSRNMLSHVYKQSVAEEIYGLLPGYLPVLQQLHETLNKIVETS